MGYQGLWGWGGDHYYVIVGGLLLHLDVLNFQQIAIIKYVL